MSIVDARAGATPAMSAGEARFRAVFDNAVIGIGISDLDGTIVDGNSTLVRMFGQSIEQMRGRSVRDYIGADGSPESVTQYDELVRGERDYLRQEKRYELPDGTVFWADIVVSLVRDAHNKPSFVVGMVADITERHDLQAQLEHDASHDPLTGLPNRTVFFDQLDQLFNEEGTQRVGLCYVDLDEFKAINDSLGHEVGDQVLIEVAHRIGSCATRLGAMAARMGGDEFVLIIDNPGPDALIRAADDVLDTLAKPLHVGGYQLSTSASIGLVERAIGETSPHELVKDADITLYWAKAQGKSRWALYDAERNAAQITRYALSAAMPAALQSGQFFVEYQPLVGLADRAVVGVEALVRWRHPDLGVVPPASFIGLAEETGLIVQLGAWVLRQACTQAQGWREEYGDRAPFLSVNLAVRQLEDPTLVDQVATILRETGFDPARLQLEITESALMRNTDIVRNALQALTDLGIRIALDDFGTGYCNLTYLRRLPVHCLKIAGDFVEGLRANDELGRTDEQIVATLVSLAHTLGLSVTAEGIETSGQAERLSAIECDSGQGWLFARPMSHQKVDELLRSVPQST